ncbi:MAG: hypothetical protein JWM11_7307 [Planctomycetaceae bacterium]|nr:hypothetical protein [Planctomycetaceae bacterium]
MNAFGHAGRTRTRLDWFCDAGLGFSLLLAILCVQAVEQNHSVTHAQGDFANPVSELPVPAELATPQSLPGKRHDEKQVSSVASLETPHLAPGVKQSGGPKPESVAATARPESPLPAIALDREPKALASIPVAAANKPELAPSLPKPPVPAPEQSPELQSVNGNGIYTARTAPNRQERITQLGGTQQSERAVQAGLNWLARHQADDGHWSDERKCERDQPCKSLKFGLPTAEVGAALGIDVDPGAIAEAGKAILGGSGDFGAPIAETGLAILAFQAGGHYSFNKQKYSSRVDRGLKWLIERQQPDGRIFGGQEYYGWYEHGIATFALAEACALAIANDQKPDPRILKAAQNAIKFIETHQYRKGGWQYWPETGQGDASVSGWQVLALKSAQEAKISISPKTMLQVNQFFTALGDPKTGQTGYVRRGAGTDLTTAVGLVVQEFVLKKPKSPLALNAVKYLRRRADQGIGQSGDFYTLYNGTLAMFLAGGDDWNDWNREVRDAVIKRQETAGCARGSWNHKYNRSLDTAWAVLTLEVYYRYSTD